MDAETLLKAIDQARENSYGWDYGGSLADNRTKVIEYYLGLNTNPAPEGRSQIVDRSVYETVHTMLPSLVRIFGSSSDEICKAVPVGPDDEQAADQVTAVLNHIVTELNPWEQIIADWCHDGMLAPTSYAMAYWDESDKTVTEEYEGQSDDQIAALLADDGVEVVEHSARVDEQATKDAQAQYAQILMMAQQQGAQPPPPPEQIMLHDVKIERRENTGKVCIKVLPPEHCSVSMYTPTWTLDECPYFEYRERKSIADIRAMGLDIEDDVSDDESDVTAEGFARDRFGEAPSEDGNTDARIVWVRMVWIRAGKEGRLWYAILVGKTVLYMEPCARIPVCSMVSQALPHRHLGMSVAETVTDIQDIRTATLRGAVDNLMLSNNGRYVISDKVNLADFLDARPGGIVRTFDGALPSEGHVMPLTHPYAFDTIVGSLEYFDQMRQNRTGTSRYFSGTDAGAINRTAAGTQMLQNAASQRVEHIARTMAPAVERLFSVVHEIWSKHVNKAVTIKLRGGKWVTVDPQAWRTHRDIKISVGVGAGNKESVIAQLTAIFQAQLQLMPLGLAGPQQIHSTMMELAKMAGFANPDKFWLDPTNRPPMPPPPNPEQIKAQAQMQLEQMRQQADVQKFQAEWQHEKERLVIESERKMAELRANLELQASNDLRDAEREARRIEIQAQMDAERLNYQKLNDALDREMEKYKADLEAQTKLALADKANAPPVEVEPIKGMLETMMAQMNAPTEIVRDPMTGRAIGIKRGETVRQIARGPDGKAVGLQ